MSVIDNLLSIAHEMYEFTLWEEKTYSEIFPIQPFDFSSLEKERIKMFEISFTFPERRMVLVPQLEVKSPAVYIFNPSEYFRIRLDFSEVWKLKKYYELLLELEEEYFSTIHFRYDIYQRSVYILLYENDMHLAYPIIFPLQDVRTLFFLAINKNTLIDSLKEARNIITPELIREEVKEKLKVEYEEEEIKSIERVLKNIIDTLIFFLDIIGDCYE